MEEQIINIIKQAATECNITFVTDSINGINQQLESYRRNNLTSLPAILLPQTYKLTYTEMGFAKANLVLIFADKNTNTDRFETAKEKLATIFNPIYETFEKVIRKNNYLLNYNKTDFGYYDSLNKELTNKENQKAIFYDDIRALIINCSLTINPKQTCPELT